MVTILLLLNLGFAGCQINVIADRQLPVEVAVVDRFYPGDDFFSDVEEVRLQRWLYGFLDLDGDRIKEPLFHGDLVGVFLRHPAIRVRAYVMAHQKPPQQEIIRQLREVRKHVFWGEPIRGLVLSWESSTLISAFGSPLQKSKVDSYKRTLRQWGVDQETWKLTYEIIRLLEDLAEAGVQVYTIAGNGGRGMVNTYSFAEGVFTVGASEYELRNFVADNALVSHYERAAHQPLLIRDLQGTPVGYDVDGDQCADIALKCLSGYAPQRENYPNTPWPLLKGSSFAAPLALKRALVSELLNDGTPEGCSTDGLSGVVY